MPKAKKTITSKPKKTERRKEAVSRKPNRRKNIEGNWRGIEDRFFTKVRNGFKALLKPVSK